ncbi:MAG: hypothetical protein HQM08_28555 [Candidatus Riflebacteria bacterium]|nr:hypothetical protein [Candidatus Riflebacteria bacterium]
MLEIVLLLFVALLLLLQAKISIWNSKLVDTRVLTLEEKLDLLTECGFKLNTPFTVENLLASWPRNEFEKPGFSLVLVSLGMTEEQEPWGNHCTNLWHMDSECIEDHGDYKELTQRMVEITQGSLPLENIQDFIDVEKKEAWVSFSFKGREFKITCRVNDDWVDPDFFGKLVELLQTADPDKIFVHFDLGGQDCLLGCVTRDQFEMLLKQGIEFAPLI